MKTAQLAKIAAVFFVLVLFASASAQAATAFNVNTLWMTGSSGGSSVSSFAQGASIRMYSTVCNAASGTSGTANYYYYIYKDGSPKWSVPSSGVPSATLGPSACLSKYYAYTLPSTWTAGRYEYRATVNPCYTGSTCQLTTYFDITAASPAFSLDSTATRTEDGSNNAKTVFAQGQTIYMKAKVLNTGTGSGSGTTITFKIKKGTSIMSACTQSQLVTPSAGSSSSSTKSCNTSTSWTTGTYSYEATISPCSSTCTVTKSFELQAPAPSFTVNRNWLTATDGTTEKTAFTQGERAWLKGTVTNTGTAPGYPNYTFSITNSSGTVYSIYYVSPTTIAIGATGSPATTYNTSALAPGTYSYKLRVSPCSTSCEQTKTFTIGAAPTPLPEFTITSISLPKTTFSTGEPVPLHSMVLNNGTVAGNVTVNATVRRGTQVMYSQQTTVALNAGATLNWNDVASETTTWTNGSYEFAVSISPCAAPRTCQASFAFTESTNYLNDSNNCGAPLNVCDWTEQCIGGACQSVEPVTPEEIYAMSPRPDYLMLTCPEMLTLLRSMDGEQARQALFPNMTAEEANQARLSVLNNFVDCERMQLTLIKLNYDYPILNTFAGQLVKRGKNGHVLIGTRDQLYSDERLLFDSTEAGIKFDRAAGVLSLLGMTLSFVQGVQKYDGSWAHGFMCVGEDLIYTGDALAMTADGIADWGNQMDLFLFFGKTGVPYRTNFTQIYREYLGGTIDRVNTSAHGFATVVDTCVIADWNQIRYCAKREAEIIHLATTPLPAITYFDFSTDNATPIFDYIIRNENNLGNGRIVTRIEVATNAGTHFRETASEITGLLNCAIADCVLHPVIQGTQNYAVAIPEGERLRNATLITFTGCTGSTSDTCMGSIEAQTIYFGHPAPTTPEVRFAANQTTFYEGDEIRFTVGVNRNADGPTTQMLSTTPRALLFNSSAASCSYYDECTAYSRTTQTGDAGNYTLTYSVVNGGGLSASDYLNVAILPKPFPIRLVSPANNTNFTYGTYQPFSWSHANANTYLLKVTNTATGASPYSLNLAASTYCSSGYCNYSWAWLTRGNYSWTVNGTYVNGTKISSETRFLRVA